MRDWVHGFAARVVRPAAPEWDEREETPWPVIDEAAKIGLYGFERTQFFDPTGLTMPIVNEELSGVTPASGCPSWAPAGRRRDLLVGDPGPAGRVGAAVLRRGRRAAVAAFCSSEPDAGPTCPRSAPAPYDEATDEWVLNGQKAWATNGGIAEVHVVVASVDRELGSRGHAAFVVPPGAKGLEQGAKLKKHGLRASHTADVLLDDCRVPGACLLGGKEKLDERFARAREGQGSRGQAAMATFEVIPSDRRRAGGRHRPRRLRVRARVRQDRAQFGRPIIENQGIAFTLADMKMEIDAARLLVWRAAWMGRTARTSTRPRARCRS